jgi:hypothetical protein
MKILSNPRFLALYSGVLTVTFAATVFFGHTLGPVLASTLAVVLVCRAHIVVRGGAC